MKPRIYLHNGFGIRGMFGIRWTPMLATMGYLSVAEAMRVVAYSSEFQPCAAHDLIMHGYTTSHRIRKTR